MIVRRFADAYGGMLMKSAIRVEMLDRTDRVFPGAVHTPCVPKLPGVWDVCEPIYAVASWSALVGVWGVRPVDVVMTHRKAQRTFGEDAVKVDRDDLLAAALVCVTGVRIENGKYRACGVVLDVVLPAGRENVKGPVVWPGGCRQLFQAVSEYLPPPETPTMLHMSFR